MRQAECRDEPPVGARDAPPHVVLASAANDVKGPARASVEHDYTARCDHGCPTVVGAEVGQDRGRSGGADDCMVCAGVDVPERGGRRSAPCEQMAVESQRGLLGWHRECSLKPTGHSGSNDRPLAAAEEDELAVGTEADALHAVELRQPYLRPVDRRAPKSRDPVVAGRYDQPVVWTENRACDSVLATGERPSQLASSRV